jgi:formyl-CoA transferase
VPLDGVEKLNETISSPIVVRGSSKVGATRAPTLGEHNDQVLDELGFSALDIEHFRAEGAIPGLPTANEAA